MLAENTIPLPDDKPGSYLSRYRPLLETPTLEERIFTLCQHLGIEGVHLIKTSQIMVAQWVRLKCRYGCDNYNTNWCCPPATVTVKEAKEILREYKSALLLCGEADHPHFYENNSKKRRNRFSSGKARSLLNGNSFFSATIRLLGLPQNRVPSAKSALTRKIVYSRKRNGPQ